MPISYQGGLDKVIWPAERNGEYTVKTGYSVKKSLENRSIQKSPSSSHNIAESTWRKIWSMKVPKKIRNFLWRVCSNSIATNFLLWKRKLKGTPCCPFCENVEETPEHVLLLCPWTKCVWFGIALGCRIDRESVTTFDKWYENIALDKGCKRESDYIYIMVGYTCWNIWKERCKAIFEHKEPDPSKVLDQIRRGVAESMDLLNIDKLVDNIQKRRQQWEPPEEGWLKMNCDGAFKDAEDDSGIGVVIRNEDAKVVAGLNKTVKVNSSLMAESLAVREGLKLAVNLHVPKLMIEVNSQVLVRNLTNYEKGDWEIEPIVEDIKSLLGNFEDSRVRWITREANQAADWLAQQSKRRLSIENWVNKPPLSFVNILSRDGLPTPPSA
ncbi:hypothetical protein COLO4_29577 [Corchorus olitorius]|uniref:Uncharacterized protein n=1 Tax=Corchorus olitorius TaxID=93759 RepID=A0A1R3HE45_9ROSI|nr:hypothetical protein COLO4_29577 [Corchorus olitorius]